MIDPTQSVIPRAYNDLGAVVHLNALRTPDRAAVKVADGAERTYAQLDAQSTRLANTLRGLGLEPGERVAAWMDDSVEYVALYVAAAKANVVVVPLNSRLTHHEASYQIERTRPGALVYTASQAERIEELAQRDELTLIAAVPEGVSARGRNLSTLLQDARDSALPSPHPDDPFMVGFTSGSTGHPKGAVLTHRSSMIMAITQQSALRIPLYPVNVQSISMSFPATIVSHLMSHLLAGGTQVLAPGKWDSERLLRLVAQEHGTHMLLPAPVLVEFTDAAREHPDQWQTLCSVLHAGSRADPKILEALADVVGVRYTEGWGMTEVSGGVAAATTPSDVLRRPPGFFASVGRPVPGTVVEVVDDDRKLVPHDGETVGELAISSPSLFAGYWEDPEATAAVVSNGWYYSGDLGSIDGEGNIAISDRGKNLIRSGGMNIYPAELELVLERCPGVQECAIVGAPHPRWGESPVAVIVRQPDSDTTAETLIAFATEHLASYKKPTSVVFVDALPRTTGGKLVRAQVREMTLQLIG
jgi:fatty-acyl-CoA synthase